MFTIELHITITVSDCPEQPTEQSTTPQHPTAPSEEAPREKTSHEKVLREKVLRRKLLFIRHASMKREGFFKSLIERRREEEEKAKKAAAVAAVTRVVQREAGRLAAHIIPSLPEAPTATRPAFIFPYRSSHPPRSNRADHVISRPQRPRLRVGPAMTGSGARNEAFPLGVVNKALFSGYTTHSRQDPHRGRRPAIPDTKRHNRTLALSITDVLRKHRYTRLRLGMTCFLTPATTQPSMSLTSSNLRFPA